MFPLSIPIANTADPSCKILGANPTAVTAALSLPAILNRRAKSNQNGEVLAWQK
jgi:hypothetical protein